MTDQLSFIGWLQVAGMTVTGTGGLFLFVLGREGVINKRIDGVDQRAQAAAEMVRREAAEAVLAVQSRTDARQEQVRTELAQSVRELNARIDRIDTDMARRDDVRALGDQFAILSGRIDRVLERER